MIPEYENLAEYYEEIKLLGDLCVYLSVLGTHKSQEPYTVVDTLYNINNSDRKRLKVYASSLIKEFKCEDNYPFILNLAVDFIFYKRALKEQPNDVKSELLQEYNAKYKSSIESVLNLAYSEEEQCKEILHFFISTPDTGLVKFLEFYTYHNNVDPETINKKSPETFDTPLENILRKIKYTKDIRTHLACLAMTQIIMNHPNFSYKDIEERGKIDILDAKIENLIETYNNYMKENDPDPELKELFKSKPITLRQLIEKRDLEMGEKIRIAPGGNDKSLPRDVNPLVLSCLKEDDKKNLVKASKLGSNK